MREQNVVHGQKIVLHSHPWSNRLIRLRVHFVDDSFSESYKNNAHSLRRFRLNVLAPGRLTNKNALSSADQTNRINRVSQFVSGSPLSNDMHVHLYYFNDGVL